MKTVLLVRRQDADAESVELALRIQTRLFRPAIYHVDVVNDTRRDWDVRVQYTYGPELKWATNAPWRTVTPEPARLAMAFWDRNVQEYERMGYR